MSLKQARRIEAKARRRYRKASDNYFMVSKISRRHWQDAGRVLDKAYADFNAALNKRDTVEYQIAFGLRRNRHV